MATLGNTPTGGWERARRGRRIRPGRGLRVRLAGVALALLWVLSPHGLGARDAQPVQPVAGPPGSAAGAPAAPATATSSVWVVRRGDTLWDIARHVAPHEDPRRVVHALMEGNGLRDAQLRPGMVLRLPESVR